LPLATDQILTQLTDMLLKNFEHQMELRATPSPRYLEALISYTLSEH